VRALKELRRERSERRAKTGTTNLQIQQGQRSGNLVVDVEEVSFAHQSSEPPLQILDRFSTTIMRGDKLGIIGPNGSGKTTLLKILLGELAPQSGKVRLGANLQIAYFDQLRGQLDEQKTVEEDVADGYQTIQVNGQNRHVLGYLQDFLFTPERARTPIKQLSGGERNRVLLAKLFAKPANVIVLDEPTNDLDAETLEMLESRLVDYTGTLLVVSHDREFLNNVVTSTIAFEVNDNGQRVVQEYIGGYDDWLRQKQKRASGAEAAPSTSDNSAPTDSTASQASNVKLPGARRLSFKEQKELDSLPDRIAELESRISNLQEIMASPEFYKQPGAEIAKHQQELKGVEQELATAYSRWEALEQRI
jgi:ATP-binding cassette subfamily F protein uup